MPIDIQQADDFLRIGILIFMFSLKNKMEVNIVDTLVESLMEELNCKTVFKIPIFGGIPIYESVVVTWIIMLVVLVLCVLLVKNLSIENPSRKQLVLETAVSGLYNFFKGTVGENGIAYIPYLASVAIYIGIANLIGLLGFKPPTKDMQCHHSTCTDEYYSDRGFRYSSERYKGMA